MFKKPALKILLTSLIIISLVNHVFSEGKVYLVLGSDTAIWTGMNTARYNNTYDQSLYTDPLRNAYTVMDPAFRAELVDSYGQPMKMTWWMMAGNIFRYATNNNMPVPNIMTLYLMKKYHGENVIATGDELSLHYHTFYWSDYDKDGLYFWNQSKTFLESLDDFEVTLAQFLLEEQVFPVSFRSGWHYMDNDWQHYLDEKVLPYSMHNDYPSKRTEDSEPIDNIFDWSQAPSQFVPYHPAKDNYQVPGDGPGWQVRSASFQRTKANNLMDDVFAAANQGTDQVACFWAHLPESDFPENMQIIDSLAHKAAAKYPDVKFQYCTAIEAMQLWRGSIDSIAPVLQFSQEQVGESVYFTIQSNETIFQTRPFVAVKNIYEEYSVLECVSTGANEWKTIVPVPQNSLAKAGVTVCDSMGNQSMEFISFLPDDKFIDNEDASYSENDGSWTTSSKYAWGTDSRFSTLETGSSASVAWDYQIPQSSFYNVFVQFPDIDNRAEKIRFLISNNQVTVDTIFVDELLPSKKWNYLATIEAQSEDALSIEMSASGDDQNGKILAADVIKFSALVKDKNINISEGIIDFGAISVQDSAAYSLVIFNYGISDLSVSSISSLSNLFKTDISFPLIVSPMSSQSIDLSFFPEETGKQIDTLVINSDDPKNPILKVMIAAEVVEYFFTIDNEDSDYYEEFGEWKTSVANIYGPTSRYAYLNANPLASARFYTTLKKSGLYEILEIVPKTVNSTDDALYEIHYDGGVQAAWRVNQNEGSGNWVSIGNVFVPADTEIELWVKDTGNSTNGPVIRTDAVRFQWIDDGASSIENNPQIAKKFSLEQNYPNPFNPSTVIAYQIPKAGKVTLTVYNALGQKIATLVDGKQSAGFHKETFSANGLANGIYYYKISSGSFQKVRKMILIK
ncbi:MAG: T9SS C-terminal target domain-containing protein [Calditrichaeota bacterium]|nr:MAG: T9SS C-terminal target domain-containing protein [Calditrichota bacterium]MBL1204859.1 T9SS C-terminal target domain-containing protein [Calditrichota bacterium]NOG44688.1 T9SS type A sorting domain-containing protein [Calditrichota bacterium]